MTVDPIDTTHLGPAEQLRGTAPESRLRPDLRVLRGGLSDVVTELEHTERSGLVAPEVVAEVEDLAAQGYDVRIVAVDKSTADTETSERVRNVTNTLVAANPEEAKRVLFDSAKYRAQAIWLRLSKRAIALHTLYMLHKPDRTNTLGEGIDPDVYDRPIFGGQSARQVLTRRKGANKANTIVNKYCDFVDPTVRLTDTVDEHGLTQADYLRGVVDSRAVHTRAVTAANSIRRHFAKRKANGDNRPIVGTSLACGAAGPMYATASDLEADGHVVERIIAVDQDPMALATAVSYGEHVGVAGKLEVQLRDLIRDKLTDYIKPHSVSFVDLLGFFEYLPDRVTLRGLARMVLDNANKQEPQTHDSQERTAGPSFRERLKSVALNGLRKYAERPDRENAPHYKAAADILRSAREIVEPGGIIVFGNMLNERPDQEFFNTVWPELHQRSVSEVLQIIADAGFDPKTDVSVEIPDDGVYAVYTLRVPEKQRQQRSTSQFVGRWILKQVIADY